MTSLATPAATSEDFHAAVHREVLGLMGAHVGRLQWSKDRIRAEQKAGLRHLLSHAKAASAFHARRLRAVDPGAVELADLTRLPVMTKGEMMGSLDEVFTDGRLSPSLVERALAATGSDPLPIHEQFVAMATGGSSGMRGVFVLDRAGMASYLLALARPLVARLQRLGGPPPGGLSVAMVGATSAVHATRATTVLANGAGSPVRFTHVPATLPVHELVRRLNDQQPQGLYGYPTLLAQLADEQRAGRLRISPVSVTSTSETLRPEMRATIHAGFGTPPADTFGSTEGLVGAGGPGDEVLVFNSDMCIVELVDDAYEPVADGTPSSKVLITNLFNLTQPLIRYELEDSFVRAPDVAEHGHLRASVRGRMDDLLVHGDAVIHPIVVRSLLVKNPAVLDYQVRQTARGLDVDVLLRQRLDLDDLRRRLEEALAAAGWQSARVHPRVVDSLPRQGDSGKLRRFVPLA